MRLLSASVLIVLGLILGTGLLQGSYPATANPQAGESYTPVAAYGTIADSGSVFDLTSSPTLYVSALLFINDGTETIWVQEGCKSASAMTLASFPVYAGEQYVSPLRVRHLTAKCRSGLSAAFRLRAGK